MVVYNPSCLGFLADEILFLPGLELAFDVAFRVVGLWTTSLGDVETPSIPHAAGGNGFCCRDKRVHRPKLNPGCRAVFLLKIPDWRCMILKRRSKQMNIRWHKLTVLYICQIAYLQAGRMPRWQYQPISQK